jgi:membrane-associated phospholipid phosphatase
MTWQRTNKFKTQLEGVRRAIRSAWVELMLALALIAAGAAGLVQQPRGLLLLLFLRLSLQGVGYLAAPILALIGEWDLARGADREPAADLPFEQKNKAVFTDLSPWVEGSKSAPSLETIGSDARSVNAVTVRKVDVEDEPELPSTRPRQKPRDNAPRFNCERRPLTAI